MKYTNLDGTNFEGPIFHPRMEITGILCEDGVTRTYLTKFKNGIPVCRVELEVDELGNIIYPEDNK